MLLLDLRTGEEIAVVEVSYPHGVIDSKLPSNNAELPPDTALQDPADYLEVLYRGIPAALAAGKVRGRGGDRPRHRLHRLHRPAGDRGRHAALPARGVAGPPPRLGQALEAPLRPADRRPSERGRDRALLSSSSPATAGACRPSGTSRSSSRPGGRTAPSTTRWTRSSRRPTGSCGSSPGSLVRASCTAGYKACWSAHDGLPSRAFFEAAYPGFPDPSEKLGTSFAPPGRRAGTLRPEVAARLGLSPDGRRGRRQRRLVRLGPGGRCPASRRVRDGRRHLDLRPRHRPTRGPDAGNHRGRRGRHPPGLLRLRGGASRRRGHVRLVRGAPARLRAQPLRSGRELVHEHRAGGGGGRTRARAGSSPSIGGTAIGRSSATPTFPGSSLASRWRPRRPRSTGRSSSRWPSGRGGSSRTSSSTASPSPRWSPAAGSPSAARS